MRSKISVIGAGFVGATTAQRIAEQELGDVVLLDIVDGMPQGKALDMMQSASVEGFDGTVSGASTYDAVAGSNVVVITAGIPRKPGMDREELAATNAGIVGNAAARIAEHAPDAFIIVVTNPLDVMTYVAWKRSGFPASRVCGMAGVLDTSRMKTFIAMELGVSVLDVQTMILGGHGDHMVPLLDYTTVSGIPVRHLLDQAALARIVERARKGGGEIVGLLKTGSAYYAPSSSAVQMTKAILLDQKRLLPMAAYCTGQYGIDDLYIGVPAVLGAGGVERIIELELSDADRGQLQESAQVVGATLATLGYR